MLFTQGSGLTPSPWAIVVPPHSGLRIFRSPLSFRCGLVGCAHGDYRG